MGISAKNADANDNARAGEMMLLWTGSCRDAGDFRDHDSGGYDNGRKVYVYVEFRSVSGQDSM